MWLVDCKDTLRSTAVLRIESGFVPIGREVRYRTQRYCAFTPNLQSVPLAMMKREGKGVFMAVFLIRLDGDEVSTRHAPAKASATK